MLDEAALAASRAMKAVEIPQFGLDHLRINDVAEPALGPRLVRVAVRAVSLNYRDYLVVKGSYNPKLVLPFVPGSDMAGEVVEVSPGVTRWKSGDRVMGCFMPAWQDGPYLDSYAKSALGGAVPGVLAEQVSLPDDALVAVPDNFSFEEASTLPCAGVTAWNALVAQGSIKAGDTVLLQGTGGVSIFALQIARLRGARVIITSSSDEKLARAQSLGADAGINYRTTREWDKRARELTAGRGVDHVVEVGGAGTFEKSLNAVRGGGRISYIGVLAGIKGEINMAWVFHKHLTVQGIYVGSRTMFEDLARALTQGNARPVIDRVFPLAEIATALRHMEAGAHFGKIVVRVS